MCGSGIEPYRELQFVKLDNTKQSLLEIYTNRSEHKHDVYMDFHSPNDLIGVINVVKNIITWRHVQRKNVVNDVDMARLRAPRQNGPYKN